MERAILTRLKSRKNVVMTVINVELPLFLPRVVFLDPFAGSELLIIIKKTGGRPCLLHQIRGSWAHSPDDSPADSTQEEAGGFNSHVCNTSISDRRIVGPGENILTWSACVLSLMWRQRKNRKEFMKAITAEEKRTSLSAQLHSRSRFSIYEIKLNQLGRRRLFVVFSVFS